MHLWSHHLYDVGKAAHLVSETVSLAPLHKEHWVFIWHIRKGAEQYCSGYSGLWECCIHGSEFLLLKLFHGGRGTTQHKNEWYSPVKVLPRGRKKKKIWIPVPLPNIQWNKNGTAPKGEWEGQSPFPYGLMAWELRKSDEPKVQTSQPVFCPLGLKKITLNVNVKPSLFSPFPTK